MRVGILTGGGDAPGLNAAIRAAGGEVHYSVKKTTTYLVAGDKTGKSKLDQAKKFGTVVLTEQQLYEKIGSVG